MKYSLFILFICSVMLLGFRVEAQQTDCPPGDEYCLLAPIPLSGPGGTDDKTADINTYIPAMFRLAIGIAGGLAVLRIIVGGIKYMTTDAFSGKSEAKETIQNALVGLLLAISAYTILYTIDPSLVKLDFSIEGLRVGTPLETGTGSTTPAGGTRGPSYGNSWPTDATIRNDLRAVFENNVTNKPNCSTIGQTNCTSLTQISPTVVNKLKSLKTACDCELVITGGTEYWLHGNRTTELNETTTEHKPGGRVVDLRIGGSLDEFLRTNGQNALNSPLTRDTCSVGTDRWLYERGLYVNETIGGNEPHWHVCF